MSIDLKVSLGIGIPTLLFTLATIIKLLIDWWDGYLVKKIMYQIMEMNKYYIEASGNFSTYEKVGETDKNYVPLISQEILSDGIGKYFKLFDSEWWQKLDYKKIKELLDLLKISDLIKIYKNQKIYVNKIKNIRNWIIQLNIFKQDDLGPHLFSFVDMCSLGFFINILKYHHKIIFKIPNSNIIGGVVSEAKECNYSLKSSKSSTENSNAWQFQLIDLTDNFNESMDFCITFDEKNYKNISFRKMELNHFPFDIFCSYELPLINNIFSKEWDQKESLEINIEKIINFIIAKKESCTILWKLILWFHKIYLLWSILKREPLKLDFFDLIKGLSNNEKQSLEILNKNLFGYFSIYEWFSYIHINRIIFMKHVKEIHEGTKSKD